MATTTQFANRFNEAVGHHKAGRLDRAEAIYRQLAVSAPKFPQVFEVWGMLAEQRGRTEEAIKLYGNAWRLDPKSSSVTLRLATVLVGAGRPTEAESMLKKSLTADPRNDGFWAKLGYVQQVLGRAADALRSYDRAVELNPKHAGNWAGRGLVLALAGGNFDALECFHRALQLDPELPMAHYGRAQALHKTYRLEEALREYEWYIQRAPNDLEAKSYRLFALQNLDWPPERLFAEHVAYGQAIGQRARPPEIPNRDPSRRLRVAILSPDLRTHSCAYFLEPLLRHLDREQFEIYLYHDHFQVDEVSDRLRRQAAVWRNFVGQSNALVEQTIRQDQPDILMDLTGHIGVTIRLPLYPKRLAPVQITYLGYPDTTGVPGMDYRFTDPIADPPGEADAFATEKLVRFSSVAWTYSPPADAPEPAPLPCLSGAPLTFGCFNSPTKFTDEAYRCWGEILRRVPGSRLLLKGRDFEEQRVREYLLSRMQAVGVPIDRLELLPRTLTTAEHLAQYARVDVALDTFPYNGTTTTCEALWMGRPVITVRGNRHAARVGASLLTAVGHAEWIASTHAAYVETVVRVATEIHGNGAKAIGDLRLAMRGSALLDERGQAAGFAQALRDCWTEQVDRIAHGNSCRGVEAAK